MAGELIYLGNKFLETGLTVIASIYMSGSHIDDISCIESPTGSAIYIGNMSGVAGTYEVVFTAGNNSIYLGSGIIKWDGISEIVPAVLTDITGAVIDGTLTLEQVLRILLATENGITEGAGTAVNKFYDPTGSTVRVQTDFDVDGNRQIVTYNL
jgi:hypothetical protein